MVDFIQWVKGMGPIGGVLYAVFYIAGTALFFPGLPLTLGAGFIYGAVIGTLVVSPASVASGFKVVVLLRLQPVIPFNMLNYALGLTSIRWRDYALASWIGMLPATVLYVYLGSIMSDVSDLLRGRPNSGVAGRVLLWGGLASMVVLVWWLGRIAKRALREEMGPDAGRA